VSGPRDTDLDETSAADPAETFLAGRVIARQPTTGYRAALDTVLLGAAIQAGAGEQAVELGCGSGAALLIAAERNGQARFLGVERDLQLVALAEANARANASAPRVEVVAGDVLALPHAWRDRFDQAFLNPPFHDDTRTVRAPRDPARRAAFVDETGGTAAWIAAALAAVRSGGRVTLIQRADRLADVLAALGGAAGEIHVRAVHPRRGAPARRVVVRARKGSRSPLLILPSLVVHEDEDGFTEETAAILEGRCGLALDA
jgi:tRNA1(Val) A37 N6-methylase TrmN6